MRDVALLLGAVARHDGSVTCWEGLREFLRSAGVALDYALFSTYERLVDALVAGHVQASFSDPLAHVRIRRRTDGRSTSIATRDVDREFQTRIVVRRDAGIGKLADLHGKTIAVGSRDSAHGRILPLHFLKKAGVDVDQLTVHGMESDPGKHGDTPGSELLVLGAVQQGRAQAGAVGATVWKDELAAGRIDPHRLEILWSTPPFARHVIDGHPSLPGTVVQAIQRPLFEMRWNNPKHRKLLDAAGHRLWVPPREEGYAALVAALDEAGWT